MGFFDSIFGNQQEGEGFELIPLTPSQKAADQFLWDLFRNIPEFNPRQIAGLTEAEQNSVQTANRVSAEGIPGLSEAVNAIRELMNSPIDVANIPGMEGLFNKTRELGADLLGKNKRAMTLTGNRISESSAGERVYGNTLQGIMEGFITSAFPFFQQKLQAKYDAPMNLANLATQEVTTPMNIGTTTGALPRQIQQMMMDAVFEAMRTNKNFPYGGPANAASATMNNQAYMYDPGVTSPSIYSQVAAMVGALSGGGANIQQPQQAQTWETTPYKNPYGN